MNAKHNNAKIEEYSLGVRYDRYVADKKPYAICIMLIFMCLFQLFVSPAMSKDRKTLVTVGINQGYLSSSEIRTAHFATKPTATIAGNIFLSLLSDPNISENTFVILKKNNSQCFSGMLYRYLACQKEAKRLLQDKDTGVTTAYLLGCYIEQQNADIAGGFASAYIWQIFLNIFTWTIMFIAVAILLYYLLAHAVIACELSDFSHKAK